VHVTDALEQVGDLALFVPSSRVAWWLRRRLLGSKLGQRAALPAGAKTPAAA
jgi:hypothetical protein